MGAVESKASIAPRARAISCTMYGHKNSHHLIAMNPLKYTNEGRQTHGSQNLSLKKSRRRENKGGREGISRPHWPRYQQSTVNKHSNTSPRSVTKPTELLARIESDLSNLKQPAHIVP